MRRKGLWLSVLATALIAGSASAATITYGGNGFNFFTYNEGLGNDTNNNYGLDHRRWDSDQVSLLNSNIRRTIGSQPDEVFTTGASTSYQQYDIEETFWYYDGDLTGGTLHIGIVTGMNSAGTNAGSSVYYRSGDLFVGLGQSGDLTYAIGTSRNEAGSGAAADRTATIADTPWTVVSANPFNVNDPFRANGGTNVGAGTNGHGTVDWTQGVDWSVTNVHNFLAVAIDIDAAGALDLTGNNGGLSFHWTMGCGNDVIDHLDTTPFAPVVPVPAAAPLGLLGMGLLALVRRVRRRPEC